MKYVIFHGSLETKNDAWYGWLKNELESKGHSVILESYPLEDFAAMTEAGKGNWSVKNQTLVKWMKFFESNVLGQLDEDEPIVFLARSLSPLFVLHILEMHQIKLDAFIAIAPFYTELQDIDWRVDAVCHPFYEGKHDWKDIKRKSPRNYVIHSDNDKYVPPKVALDFADKLEASVIEVKGGGHFGGDDGYETFPLVLELCLIRADR